MKFKNLKVGQEFRMIHKGPSGIWRKIKPIIKNGVAYTAENPEGTYITDSVLPDDEVEIVYD